MGARAAHDYYKELRGEMVLALKNHDRDRLENSSQIAVLATALRTLPSAFVNSSSG